MSKRITKSSASDMATHKSTKIFKKRDYPTLNFYLLEVNNNHKLELKEFNSGRIWFHYVSRNEYDKPTRILKMYCSETCAENMKKFGVVKAYKPALADPEECQTPYTLIVPITNLIKFNPQLTKTDYYRAIKYTLECINSQFGLVPLDFIDIHVSILPVNETFNEPSGKIFLNFDKMLSTEKIANLRELICGSIWMLAANEITGYCHYMNCFYSVEKSTKVKVDV